MTNATTESSPLHSRPAPNPRLVPARDVDNFAAFVEAFREGRVKSDHPIGICQTPPVLQTLGAPDVPMTIRSSVLGKAIHKHGLSAELLKHLPAQLYDPALIFESDTKTNALVVMTELTSGGKGVAVAIHLGVQCGRQMVNAIASVHAREAAQFAYWMKEGLLRYRK